MTNYEKIMSMTIEEVADEIRWLGCEDSCPLDGHCNDTYPDLDCKTKLIKWLNREVEK